MGGAKTPPEKPLADRMRELAREHPRANELLETADRFERVSREYITNLTEEFDEFLRERMVTVWIESRRLFWECTPNEPGMLVDAKSVGS